MPLWVYDPRTRRYRITPDGVEATGQPAGTFIGHTRRLELRDRWTDAMRGRVERLAERYATGDIGLSDWVLQMRKEVRIAYIDQYLLASGGRNNMTPADWGRVGQAIRQQNDFLQEFAEQVKRGEVTLAQMQNRATMYIDSSTAMFERAEVLGRGMPDLPQYPADGGTQCRSRCRCNWRIVERELVWECTWVLDGGAVRHCDDCLSNAANWSPLVVQKI